MNRRLLYTVIACSLSGLLFGNDIGAMSSAAPSLKAEFSLSSAALGFAVSSALIGAIAGSIVAGFLADAIGRRPALSISCAVYFLGVVGVVFAQGLTLFATGRVLCGIAIGLISVIAPMYLAEVSPAQLRGRLVGAFQLSLSLGVVAAFALGYLFALHTTAGRVWRYSLGVGAIPALLCEIFLLLSSPSPRWLAIEGRWDDVTSVFIQLGSADPAADKAGLVASLDDLNVAHSVKLFTRQHGRSILLGITVAVFNQLTGVNALLYYILDIFADMGSAQRNGRADAIVVSALSLVVTMLSVGIIDKVGRKPLLLAGAIGMGACLGLFPVVRSMHWPPSMVVVLLACYNAFFGFSQGVVVWVYLSEIFPLPVRARGQSLGSTAHWVANALVVGVFPTVVALLHERVFLVLAFLMVVQFFTVLFFYPETKRAKLEAVTSNMIS